MSRLNSTYEDAMVQWAYAVLGIPVMWDFQSAAATGRGPTRKQITLPYAVLGYVSGPQSVGGGFDMTFKEVTTYTYKFFKQVVVSINIYANEGHMSLMQSLINSPHLPSKNAVLRQAGLSYWGNTPPNDLTDILDTKAQLRVVSDFTFAYRQDIDDETGVVETINIGAAFDDIEMEVGVALDAPSLQFDDAGNSQYMAII